jgi:hypothetical protein
VTLTVASGTGYSVGSSAGASGSIADNDPAALTAAGASITEGNTGTSTVSVTVTLSNPSAQAITVAYRTVDGTATGGAAATTPGADYVTASGTLTFAPGVTSRTVVVTIVGDTAKEANETFSVVLSNPTGGAVIATGTATVTILDDDSPQLASRAAPGSGGVAALTPAQLAAAVADAEALWLAVRPQADFGGVTFSIRQLGGLLLGATAGREISIDATAAGWGWSVSYPGGSGPHMDLLTVVLHELGHIVGFDDDGSNDLMGATLAPGQMRTLPAVAPAPVGDTSLQAPIAARLVRAAVIAPGLTRYELVRPVTRPRLTIATVRPRPRLERTTVNLHRHGETQLCVVVDEATDHRPAAGPGERHSSKRTTGLVAELALDQKRVVPRPT